MTPGSLLDWYRVHGRAHLPWRQTRDPYRIVVSEFMLQQTQVDRVIPLYEAFIAAFPDFAFAGRSRGRATAVRMWRGLGYNSRAMRLQALSARRRWNGTAVRCRAIATRCSRYPASVRTPRRPCALLRSNSTTSRLIRTSAASRTEPPSASSIRTSLASDAELDARARAALEPGTAHDWNSAMMDVGATICTARAPKCLLCPLRAGCVAAPVDAAALAR